MLKKAGKTISELFEIYQKKGGTQVYRTFYRKVKYLELNKYVTIQKVFGGKKGKYFICYSPLKERKI